MRRPARASTSPAIGLLAFPYVFPGAYSKAQPLSTSAYGLDPRPGALAVDQHLNHVPVRPQGHPGRTSSTSITIRSTWATTCRPRRICSRDTRRAPTGRPGGDSRPGARRSPRPGSIRPCRSTVASARLGGWATRGIIVRVASLYQQWICHSATTQPAAADEQSGRPPGAVLDLRASSSSSATAAGSKQRLLGRSQCDAGGALAVDLGRRPDHDGRAELRRQGVRQRPVELRRPGLGRRPAAVRPLSRAIAAARTHPRHRSPAVHRSTLVQSRPALPVEPSPWPPVNPQTIRPRRSTPRSRPSRTKGGCRRWSRTCSSTPSTASGDELLQRQLPRTTPATSATTRRGSCGSGGCGTRGPPSTAGAAPASGRCGHRNLPGRHFPLGPPFSPPVYPSYPPPYPAPLRGIQIQVRVVDPTNQRIKSLTIRQDFTDKLVKWLVASG